MRHAQTATKVLFDSDYTSINVSDLLSALESDPKLMYVDKGEAFSVPLIKMRASTAFFGSVCEFSASIRDERTFSHRPIPLAAAKNLVKSNGLKLNNIVVKDPFYVLKPEDLLDERVAIVKVGPHRHLILVLK